MLRFRTFRWLIISGIILSASSLLAYMPGRWSPMDVYVEQGKSGGPRTMLVQSDGKVRQQARFIYSGNGLLKQEIYQDGAGKTQGRTVYLYKKGKLSAEKTFNSRGAMVERKVFTHTEKGLATLKIYDAGQRLLVSRSFSHNGGKILKGEDLIGKNRDKFLIRFTKKKPSYMSIQKEDGAEIGRVKFAYDGKGRIISRLREHGNDKFKCVYRYNRAGKLETFSYYNFSGNRWVLTKTLRLKY